jgi:hypothetical protein
MAKVIWFFIFGLIAIASFRLGSIVTSSAIPDPITMILLGVGLISFAGISRKRLKRNSLQ